MIIIMVDFILHIIFGSSLILILALFSSMFAYGKSASFRHAIWASAVLGLAVLPLLTPVLPKYSLVNAENSNHIRTRYLNVSVSDTIISSESQTVTPVNETPETISIDETASYTISEDEKTSVNVAEEKSVSVSGIMVVLSIWGTIAFVRLIGLILSHNSARKVLRESIEEENLEVLRIFDSVRKSFRLESDLKLYRNSGVKIPFAIGFFRPKIVMPEENANLNRSELEAVLRHETAHIARGDLRWWELARFVSVFYWFHPLLWFALRRMRIEREKACDDAVLGSVNSPEEYASILLELAAGLKLKNARRSIPACAIAIARRSVLKERIISIMNAKLDHRPLGKVWKIVIVLFSILAISVVASLIPFAPKELEEDEKIAQIAVDPDAPKVPVKLLVLDLNGNPAPGTIVQIKPFGVFKTEDGNSRISEFEGCDKPILDTDASGRAEFNAVPGINIVLYSPFSSFEPICIASGKTARNITLRQKENAEVAFEIEYSDGNYVPEQSFRLESRLKPAIGADIPELCELSFFQIDSTTSSSGTWNGNIFPGDYTFIIDRSIKYSETVNVKQGTGQKFRMELPVPVFIECIGQDGFPAVSQRIVHFGVRKSDGTNLEQETFVTYDVSDKNGIARFFPSEFENYLWTGSEDGKFGFIEKIDPGMCGRKIVLKMRESPEIRAKMIDKSTGKPIPGREFGLRLIILHTEKSDKPYDYSMDFINMGGRRKVESEGREKIVRLLSDRKGDIVFNLPQLPDGSESLSYFIVPGNAWDSGGISGNGQPIHPPFELFRIDSPESPFDLGEVRMDESKRRFSFQPQPSMKWITEEGEFSPEMSIESENDVVDFTGKVLLPDGSPAKGYFVFFVYYYYAPDLQGSYLYTPQTDENGEFRMKIARKCKLGMLAYTSNDKGMSQGGPLVSDPTFITYENGKTEVPPLKLYEGTPVRGKVTNSGGTSLSGCDVRLSNEYAMLAKANGFENWTVLNRFSLALRIETDSNGEYLFYAPKGTWEVYEFDSRAKIEPKTIEVQNKEPITVPSIIKPN